MKKLIFCFFFFQSLLIYSQELTSRVYSNDLETVSITKNILEYVDESFDTSKIYNLNISVLNKISFSIRNGKKELLLLYSDTILLLYTKDKLEPFFFGVNKKTDSGFERFYKFKNIKVDSFLTEGTKKYSGDNLANYALETPWVEDEKGNGIGSHIYLPKTVIRNIYIGNGYVSFEKPYLYEANARVKKIRITDITNKLSFDIILEDSPNPQKIEIGKESINREIVIEILAVYKGLKYNDICVNFIIPEA